MSRPVPGRPGLFYDYTARLYFQYDQQTDQLVYSNGLRLPRPANVPRTTYLPQALQQGYQYQSPPSSSDGYVPNSASLSGPAPQYPQGSETPSPPGRHQSQASIDAVTASLSGVSLNRTFQPNIYEVDGVRVVSAQNPQSQVRTIYGTGPAEKITDPDLLRGGVTAYRRLYGTEGESEPLYSNFRLKSHDFFSVGRVFFVLWAEPAGESQTAITTQEPSDSTLQGRYKGERVFSKVRRFVVVRKGKDYCSALPIMTYSKQGVGKQGVNKSEHAIIYTGSQPPKPLSSELPQSAGEAPMRQQAVRVVPDDRESKLDPMSRIDFGKVHTVQHNIKVRPFGMVHQQSMQALVTQFGNVWLGAPASAASNTASASGSKSASGSARGSSGRRYSVDSETRAAKSISSNRQGKLRAIDSDQEEAREQESDDNDDQSEDDESRSSQVEVTQTRQAFARLRAQRYTPDQAIAYMATKLRQRNPSMSHDTAVARIRAQLSTPREA